MTGLTPRVRFLFATEGMKNWPCEYRRWWLAIGVHGQTVHAVPFTSSPHYLFTRHNSIATPKARFASLYQTETSRRGLDIPIEGRQSHIALLRYAASGPVNAVTLMHFQRAELALVTDDGDRAAIQAGTHKYISAADYEGLRAEAAQHWIPYFRDDGSQGLYQVPGGPQIV